MRAILEWKGCSAARFRAGIALEKAVDGGCLLGPDPPPLAEPPAEPVLIVIAGAPGSPTGALSRLAHERLAGLGSEPEHIGFSSSDAAGDIGAEANTIMHTDTSDPASLARAMKRFADAGYDVEFHAAAAPETFRELNSLEMRLIVGGNQSAGTSAPNNLSVCASNAEVNGAQVQVFREDCVWVPPLAPPVT